MKSFAILLTIMLTLAAPAWSEDSDLVILQLRVDRRQVEVLPRGDLSEAFLVDPDVAVRTEGRWQLGERFVVSRDSLSLAGRAYGAGQLGRMAVERRGDRVLVTLFERPATAQGSPRRTNINGVAENLLVAGGDFVRGHVLSFGGDVRVDGEVNRSVVALGGDVVVAPGGVVRGSVVSVGGDVHKDENASVYGDLYAGNRRRFRPRWFERTERNRLNFDLALDYNRVTGALPWACLEVQPDVRNAPAFRVAAGYAFESELWHYRVGVGREELRGFQFDVTGYRETKDDDRFRIAKNENLVFALLFRTDYRDYYFAEGFAARAGWAFGRDRSFSIGYQNELLRPQAAHPRLFSVFGGDPFVANYAQLVKAGDPRLATDFTGRLAFFSVEGEYRYPYFEEPASGYWEASAHAETSHPDLSSDFDYSRYYGSVIRSQSLWPDHRLRVRVAGGGAAGRLPATRLYYLGGISTLRGYDYKELEGDRFWLFNLEYTWAVSDFELFSLFDGGQIGTGPGWTDGRVRFDFGCGVSVDQAFRVQVAWAPAENDSKPLVTFRLSKPF